MKIIINGIMGRMGLAVAGALLKSPGMELIGGVDREEGVWGEAVPVRTQAAFFMANADLAIDFSLPAGTEAICRACLQSSIPLISGTTALESVHFDLLRQLSRKCPVVQTYNFSVGVNLLQNLAGLAAETLGERYDVEIVETHHRNKKDAPSGTALLLSDAICDRLGRERKTSRMMGRSGKNLARGTEIGLHSLRGGAVAGEHQLFFLGENETISLSHRAISRQAFVDGVLRACRWIKNQPPGLYSMQNVLNLK